MTTDPLTNVARQRVGQVLRGKWRLDGLLGIGGMAAVFAATHRNGNRVAIKMLHPQIAIDPSVQQRFLREGYVANSIEHEGAVSVLDDDVTDDGAVFLVMELLEGETLDARAARCGGRLPAAEVVKFADQLLDVLAAAHSKGVVHRDIKPENLFVTTKGQLKVLDFGIARLLERAGSASATKTGSMLGTPAFMPPEQALGYVKEVDQRSDIWAVGAVMFTLLTGRTVHPGTTVNEQLIAAATKPVCPTITLLPDLPPFLAHTIDRSLAFDKSKRWSNAAEMLDAIRECMEATVVASQASAPIAVAFPRATQLVSHPEIDPGVPSGSVAAELSGPMQMTKPAPTTASSMAVGRTLSDPTVTSPPRRSNAALVVALGAVLTLTAVIATAGLVLRASGEKERHEASPGASTSGEAASPETVRPQDPSNEIGSLSPSALPIAQLATIEILADGGSCNISIDGANRGTTPIHALEVEPGVHDIRCVSGGFVDLRKVDPRSGEAKRVTFVIGKASPKVTVETPPPPMLTPLPPPALPTAVTKPPKAANPLDIR